jgi:transcriptional repressor NrdR
MRCPYCASDEDRVIDSRPVDEGAAIRRRRECQACGQRFSTYERTEQRTLTVRKRSGATQPFDRDKVLAGVRKATKNRPLDDDDVKRTVARVEARVRGLGRREVDSSVIGAEVLAALRELDSVAYLRFASVHKDFSSAEDFARELAALDRGGDEDAEDRGAG